MRDTLDQRKVAVQRISIIGAIVNALMSALKIIGGLLTGSAALIADGLHSLSDLATDVMVVFLLGISHKKPDKEHPWGHGRFETLGTVFLAIILLTVAGFMTWDSLKLLFAGEIPSPPAWPALVIAAISILANEVLFFYTLKVGKATHSSLIIANAWHHRTDSLSSIVVLIAIAGAILGVWWLDALAAVLVALLIGKIGIDLLLKSLAELVDTGLPQERVNQLRETALSVEGVSDVHNFRTRMMGGQGLLEMHLQVPAHMSASEGHFIGDTVCAKLKDRFDDIGYIIYHIDTYDDELMPDAVQPLMPSRNEVKSHLNAAISRLLGDCPAYELTIYYAPKFIELEIKFCPEVYPLLEYTGLAAESLETNLQQELQSLNWFRNIRIWLPVNDSQAES
jgi:cation diffusion facilitator family transporter